MESADTPWDPLPTWLTTRSQHLLSTVAFQPFHVPLSSTLKCFLWSRLYPEPSLYLCNNLCNRGLRVRNLTILIKATGMNYGLMKTELIPHLPTCSALPDPRSLLMEPSIHLLTQTRILVYSLFLFSFNPHFHWVVISCQCSFLISYKWNQWICFDFPRACALRTVT